MRIPAIGMDETAPKAEPSSVRPRRPLLRFRLVLTAGMREIHVETMKPCSRKYTTVAHHAFSVVESFTLPECTGATVPNRKAEWYSDADAVLSCSSKNDCGKIALF